MKSKLLMPSEFIHRWPHATRTGIMSSMLCMVIVSCQGRDQNRSGDQSHLSSVNIGTVKGADYDQYRIGVDVTSDDGTAINSPFTLTEQTYPAQTRDISPTHKFEIGSYILVNMAIIKDGKVLASTEHCRESMNPFQVKADPSENFVSVRLCRLEGDEDSDIVTEPAEEQDITIEPVIDEGQTPAPGEGTPKPGDTSGGPGRDGPVIGSYFVEWGIYGRNYQVSMIPAEKLTHLLYGFIAICGPNESLRSANPQGYSALTRECVDQQDFTVTVHDRFAALEKSYPGDKWDDPIRGNFGQLAKLKQANPHLVILPSIGGWTLSDPFFTLAADTNLRKRFVDSALQFLRDYPMFDGIDIDWEFPGGEGANSELGSAADKTNFALLMKDLRSGLNTLSQETGRNYQLTAAVGAGPKKIANTDYTAAEPYMDYIFAMTYDYYGAWNNQLGHHTGLYAGEYEKNEGFSAAASVENLLDAGVPASKIVVGFAMYGRGWKGVNGVSNHQPFSGIGNGPMAGSWEAGILDYKDIETKFLGGKDGQGINGFIYGYDDRAQAPYLWNATSGELISFDNERSVRAKANYVKEKALGGMFSWEIDADSGTLLNAAVSGLK